MLTRRQLATTSRPRAVGAGVQYWPSAAPCAIGVRPCGCEVCSMPWWRNGNGPPPGSRDDAEHTAAATNAPHNRCWGRGSGPRPDQRRPPGGNADYLHVAHVNVAYALGQQGPRGRHRLVGKMLTPALGIDCPGTGNKCLLRGNQGHRTPCPKKTFCSISAICSAPRATRHGGGRGDEPP